MLDKVAESFSDDPNFSFGKIDMDLNEVRRSELSQLKILDKFPYFFLYEKGERKKGIQWNHRENISEGTMRTFVQKNSKKD